MVHAPVFANALDVSGGHGVAPADQRADLLGSGMIERTTSYETGLAGLAWMSRPAPDTVAFLLFEDRLPAGSLVADPEEAVPLAYGPGFAETLRVAHQADITIVEP